MKGFNVGFNPSFPLCGPSLPATAPIPHPATPPERPHPEHFSIYESWLPQLPFCKHSCTVLSPEAAVSFPAGFLQQLRQHKQGTGEGLSCCFVLRPCLVLAAPCLGCQTARLQPHLVPRSVFGCGSGPHPSFQPRGLSSETLKCPRMQSDRVLGLWIRM